MPFFDELPPLDRADSRPLYAQLRALLSEHIEQHQLPPGTPVPTENELIKKFHISRITVRQAIQQLEADGLINKIQGKGTFVAAPRGRNQLRFFSSLEPWLAKQGLHVRNKVLKNTTGLPADWALDLGYPPGGQARIIKRLKILGRQPIALEHRVLPLEIAAVLDENDIDHNPIFDALDSSAKTRAYKVLYNVTAIPAAGEDAKLLHSSPGSPLIVRTGIYHNRVGIPIMAARVVFIAERMDLRLEFHRENGYWRIDIA
jgi:GntR family transcriptional regulator